MAVTHTITLTAADIPRTVAAYSSATNQPIDVSVDYQEDDRNWAIRLKLRFDEDAPTRAAALPYAHQFDGGWNWTITPDLESANELANAFVKDQEERYPDLTLCGP